MPSSPGYKRNYKKNCEICEKEFYGIKHQKYCSKTCKGKQQYKSGKVTTLTQYASISGNWNRYFQRLVNQHNRDELTVEICLELLEEQKGKCAISGVKLTCLLEVGKRFLTNVSIDRLEAGGPYTKDNIQLVCTALNSWRGDTPLEEFVWWCNQVTIHQEKEGSSHA